MKNLGNELIFKKLIWKEYKESSKEKRIPLEPYYGHLLETPSHTTLQKVRG